MAEGKFNENTRVQVPAALHLVGLGYTYLAGIKDDDYNAETNILTNVFLRSIKRINPDLSDTDAQTVLTDIIRILGNDDLGREFYGKLSSVSGTKLIDYDNPANNEWHVTTEFTCEDKETGDNFRPDITCFINGLPLAFIEVKKPNNSEGIMAEKDRIETRMKNKRFRKFINITQLMIFSNNQEYDHEKIVPIQGAFYATTSRDKVFFNVFREADPHLHAGIIQDGNYRVTEEDERIVLTHRNCLPIKGSPEYITNLTYNTPTNRILTSLLSRERFLYLLRYGFAYVDKKEEIHPDSIYYVTEIGPEFPGGPQALLDYLKANVNYPAQCREAKIQGRVLINFVVQKDGSIKNVSVLKSVHPLLDEEARRVISTMPKWKPGMEHGTPVRVQYTVPVNFRLN